MRIETTFLTMLCAGIVATSACGDDTSSGDSTNGGDNNGSDASADTNNSTDNNSTDNNTNNNSTDNNTGDTNPDGGDMMANNGAMDGGDMMANNGDTTDAGGDAGATCKGPMDCGEDQICCASPAGGGEIDTVCVAAGECGGGDQNRLCETNDDCAMFENTTCQEGPGNLPQGTMVCRM